MLHVTHIQVLEREPIEHHGQLPRFNRVDASESVARRAKRFGQCKRASITNFRAMLGCGRWPPGNRRYVTV